MEVMGTSGNIPDRVSETERTIRSGGKLLNWKTGVAKQPSSLGTMIKLKNPWNDQPENASQGKVTGAAMRHLVAAPAPTRQHPAQTGVALPPAFKKISKKGDAYDATRLRFTSRESLRPMRQADSRTGLD